MTMTEQIYFEDIAAGSEIPSLVKHPGNVQLFLFSTVTRNPHRIHYDKDFAALEGHRDLLIHGPLQGAFLVQLMTDWVAARREDSRRLPTRTGRGPLSAIRLRARAG